MATTAIDLLAPVHRLSVEQYLRMAEAGLFDDGVRVELIDGVVLEMSAAEWPHRLAVMWLTRTLVPQLDDAHILSSQQGVELPALLSMPEPDIAVLAVEAVVARSSGRPPLIIEVSATSLRFDRITKSRLYARHGVEEYWIVNVDEAVVEVHREPAGDAWATRTVHGAGEVLRPLLLPDVSVELDPLLAFMAARDAPSSP